MSYYLGEGDDGSSNKFSEFLPGDSFDSKQGFLKFLVFLPGGPSAPKNNGNVYDHFLEYLDWRLLWSQKGCFLLSTRQYVGQILILLENQ